MIGKIRQIFRKTRALLIVIRGTHTGHAGECFGC